MQHLCLLLFIIFLSYSTSSRAPDTPVNVPEGWCTSKYSRATRTTGECICLGGSDCLGPRCQRGQGMIWYTYNECPSCECVAKEAKVDSHTSISGDNMVNRHESVDVDDIESVDSRPIKVNSKRTSSDAYHDIEDNVNNSLDEVGFGFLEEYWRHIFAIGVTLTVFVILFAVLYVDGGRRQRHREEGEVNGIDEKSK